MEQHWYAKKRPHYVSGQHVKLNDLKVIASSSRVGSGYLYKEDIPDYPKPEFQVSHLQHDTTGPGLKGIYEDGGFGAFTRFNDDTGPLLWWSLAVTPEDINSAETRFLENTYPDRTPEQVQRQDSFLGKFATSPAFLDTSRIGSYRFTFSVEEVLDAYSKQFCSGEPPLMYVYETVMYKQEVMYVVLIDRPGNKESNKKYPLLGAEPGAVCAYRDGQFIWRSEVMCETHWYELIQDPEEKRMKTHQCNRPPFYMWDNVAIALNMEDEKVLHFDTDRLRENLSYCDRGEPPIGRYDRFEDAEEKVKSLWPNSTAPLERKTRQLQKEVAAESCDDNELLL